MTYVIGALLIVVGVQAAAIVAPAGPAVATRPCRAGACARAKSGFASWWIARRPCCGRSGRMPRPRSTTSTAPVRSSRGCRWRSCARKAGWTPSIRMTSTTLVGSLRSRVRGAHRLPRGVPSAQSRRRLPMAAGHGRSEVWTGRQLRGLRRLRHRHHRTPGRRGPDSRESGRPRGQPSGDPAPGRPADRGPGRRAGADRARPARRREPAAGRPVDRPQQPQASNGRVAGQRGAEGGSSGASPAHRHAGAERPSPLSRPASHGAAPRWAGRRPDLLLCRARALARHPS